MHSTEHRSTFVTVLAWIFIALSGLGLLVGVLQSVMLHTMWNTPEMAQAMQAPAMPGTPPFATFMLKNMVAFFVLLLSLNALTLAASIGLLLRRNWARLVFIGLMVFAILWNLAGLLLQSSMFAYMRGQFAAAPDAPDMSAFFIVIAVVSVVFVLGFCVLFGWIIKRLVSPRVVAEFTR